jgi:hypothetical protein
MNRPRSKSGLGFAEPGEGGDGCPGVVVVAPGGGAKSRAIACSAAGLVGAVVPSRHGLWGLWPASIRVDGLAGGGLPHELKLLFGPVDERQDDLGGLAVEVIGPLVEFGGQGSERAAVPRSEFTSLIMWPAGEL